MSSHDVHCPLNVDEDQMLGRIKDEQAAAWKDGYDTAKAAADAVFADLRAEVAAMPDSIGRSGRAAGDLLWRNAVLALFDGTDSR